MTSDPSAPAVALPSGVVTAAPADASRPNYRLLSLLALGHLVIALGPPLITALSTMYGTPGSLGMILPGLLVAGLLMAVLPGLSRPLPARSDGRAAAPRTMVGAMTLLVLVISIRSWTQLGFTTYMPFYYLEVL